ncbi:hypothetical protein B842_11035 [Corynebacterium humireducens NBRC 106098 = DSM 45392]|uniref:DUF306 domain-containing protein n=1 Tax=Corynebacterium humireducens NBRC 106098 = DSM 45392 TaxID=1223515 RepID=A0A0B5DE89_9CORY|nr:META domain-containing protein [Corynebacterium humireducens]AJE34054.1 hypothetical protein B842_11035 [Corynebacterium humireducens NBRC 106098 = DSM 45392]
MRRAVVALAAGALLVACAPDPTADVAGSSWQVTDIWTTPGEPSALPPQSAGLARLAFGEQSLSGHTGCAPIQGTVTFTRAGEPARTEDADTLRIDHIEGDTAADDCPALHTHEQLRELLAPGAEFDLRHAERELTLTLRVDAVDRPAIGLAAI